MADGTLFPGRPSPHAGQTRPITGSPEWASGSKYRRWRPSPDTRRTGEQSLVEGGKAEVVLHTRRAFQDTIQAEAISAVQELSGRRVVAFMSNNHIDPDLAVEFFILEPATVHLVTSADVDGSESARD